MTSVTGCDDKHEKERFTNAGQARQAAYLHCRLRVSELTVRSSETDRIADRHAQVRARASETEIITAEGRRIKKITCRRSSELNKVVFFHFCHNVRYITFIAKQASKPTSRKRPLKLVFSVSASEHEF